MVFFFGFIALLVAIAKPEYKKDYNMIHTHLTDASQSFVPQNGWKCVRCGRGNSSYVSMCACGNTKLANCMLVDNTCRNTVIDNSGVTKINQPVSSADEILKLKKILDEGVITQEEFDKKKKQLLDL